MQAQPTVHSLDLVVQGAVTPTASLCPPLSAQSSNPLSEWPFHVYLSFEIIPPDHYRGAPQASLTPQSKANLRAMAMLSLHFQVQATSY